LALIAATSAKKKESCAKLFDFEMVSEIKQIAVRLSILACLFLICLFDMF